MILNLHVFSVFFMTGVIWIIQMIHYPLMNLVNPDKFLEYHQRHSATITWIVGPVMIAQLFTSLGLFVSNNSIPNLPRWLMLGFTLAVFGFTFFISVPIHSRLETGFDPLLISQLTNTNWPRTILWTLHSALILWTMIAHPNTRQNL